ncbi:brachyurin-like [Agrilus planipennis]|uniref:Brachyurin-like n=1 Tax=Agrilus planipennis TaxID=224129 RepID=A0A7F5RIR6_AGRPL|nr:brachyurin-like [Agrilus planipennis]
MREIGLIFIIFSLVTAHVTRDWSNIIPAPAVPDLFASSEEVKIVGGNEAARNSLPYQVALILNHNKGGYFCGGSLITKRYVLTAAHCLTDGLISAQVILGAHNVRQSEPTQQRISSTTFKQHENYNNQPAQNDLGVIYLPTPANLNRNEAARNSLPYQVALILNHNKGGYFCGGSLITKRYVLTAAHCLTDGLISAQVILGAHNVRQSEPTQQRISSTTFKQHENYNNQPAQNDLGVIYLPTPANLNQYVQLIALPSRADVSNSFAGSQAVASGWGFFSSSANVTSDVLRYVDVPVIANDVCKGNFGSYITNSMICSGGTGNKGICSGDSGGPLVVSKKLVGVAAFVSGWGCYAGYPSAFTRVSSFLDWISANTDAVIS